ncbi:MAG: hypothetical protein WCF61_19760 [Terriglobales bacterium]
MTGRIQFINHQGKQILSVDLSKCSPAQLIGVLRELPEVVSTRPRGSVLILTDFTGASFDQEAIRVMKEAAVFDKPHVKRSAWVGTENLPPEYAKSVRTYSRREFPSFKSREEALAWLVKD